MKWGDLADHDRAGPNDGIPTDSRSVGHHDVRPEPDIVVDLDALSGSPLVEHRDVGLVIEMIAANEIRVGSNERVLSQPHARRREDLDVEPDVGVVIDDDVAVLAAENRVGTGTSTSRARRTSAAFARTTPSAPPAPTGHATSPRSLTGVLTRQAATGRLSSSPSRAATGTCGSPSCSFT